MQKKYLTTVTKLLTGLGLGYSIFWMTSHPNSALHKKLPRKTYKNISFLPHIKYHKNYKTYHLHHWLLLILCYVPLLSSKKLRSFNVLHGLFIGSILQGLTYKDRFKFSYPKQ